MKHRITILIAGLLCCCMMFGCGQQISPHDAKIIYMKNEYVFEVHSIPKQAQLVDSVILAKVLEELDTTYEESSVFTHYRVEVLANLKGELEPETIIPLIKDGGLTEDGSECILHDNDILPVVDGIYLFFINTEPDGSYLVSGPNTTMPLDDKARDTEYTTRNTYDFDSPYYEEKIQEIFDAMKL